MPFTLPIRWPLTNQMGRNFPSEMKIFHCGQLWKIGLDFEDQQLTSWLTNCCTTVRYLEAELDSREPESHRHHAVPSAGAAPGGTYPQPKLRNGLLCDLSERSTNRFSP